MNSVAKNHENLIDTRKLCRLCLKENKNFSFSLMDIDGQPNNALLQQIQECTSLKITVKDKYPPTICSPCYSKLNEIAQFRESVLKNDGILQMLVEKQENQVTSTQTQNDLVIYDPESEEVLSTEDIVRKMTQPQKASQMVSLQPTITSPKGRQECPMCHREFRNAYTLRRHIKLHTEENLYVCEYCQKKFNDRSNYRIHLRLHTGTDLYRCAVCFKQFISPSTLKYHTVVHKRMSCYKCRACDEPFLDYGALETHFNEKHSDYDHGQATSNGNEEMDLMPGDLLQIEMDDDIEEQPQVKLEPLDEDEIGDVEHVPDEEMPPESVIKKEIIEVEADKILLFRCDFCMQIFQYIEDLRSHMEMHKVKGTCFKCPDCHKAFRTEELLAVHQKMHEKDEIPPECKNCRKTFKSVLNLENHAKKCVVFESDGIQMSSPSSDTSQRLTSDEEGQSRTSDTSLLTRNTLRRCEVCAQTFESVIELERHVAVHLEKKEAITFIPQTDRPYKCNECNKSFKRKDYLLIHVRTHTGERRYKCDLCSSAFVHPSNLITHRKLHSDERPFKCDLCDATFKLFAGLKIHRKRCVAKMAKNIN